MFISLVVVTAVLSSGCATQKSVAAKPLKPASGSQVCDLKQYEIITVSPFASPDGAGVTNPGRQLAADVANRLRADFPGLFQEVRFDQSLGTTNEVVLTGIITKYQPGSREARLMLIGLGAASLKGCVVFKQGDGGRELMTAPFSKLWAWGGLLGASKGIEEMMSETAASVAATAAYGKGWKPHPKQ